MERRALAQQRYEAVVRSDVRERTLREKNTVDAFGRKPAQKENERVDDERLIAGLILGYEPHGRE
jgi:hypothetical protein